MGLLFKFTIIVVFFLTDRNSVLSSSDNNDIKYQQQNIWSNLLEEWINRYVFGIRKKKIQTFLNFF